MKYFCKDCKCHDECKYFRQGYKFCENCADYSNCELRWSAEMCEAYHEIECNNGYTEQDEMDLKNTFEEDSE